jgi:MoxR-like ATPase
MEKLVSLTVSNEVSTMPEPETNNARDQVALDQVTILADYMNSQILGQQKLVSWMLMALLADGHLLVKGAPGLAKTRAVKTLAKGIEGDFQRIQFTPDLLPSDLTGTDVYRPQDASFFSAGTTIPPHYSG